MGIVIWDTGYLGDSGFASVSNAPLVESTIDEDGSGKAIVTLFIWPENFSGYTYGIDIEIDDAATQINVDANGHYIKDDESIESAKKKQALLEKHSEDINKLFELADKMWDIR